MKYIDLHTHSNRSDGSYTPEGLIELAEQEGVSALALTDHDTIAGVQAAREAARLRNIGFLNGMEMTVAYKDRLLHVVALGFHESHPAFLSMYRKIRCYKEACVQVLVETVKKKYKPLSLEAVKQYQTSGDLDRYVVMRYFAAQNLFEDAQKIWDVYLDPAMKEIGNSFDQNVTAEEALAVIREAGGVTSLAHFHKRLGLAGLSRSEQETAVLDLKAMGLDGMERLYPNYSKEDAAFAAYMIDTHHLLPTGGTDFHGGNRLGIALGRGNGDMKIPYEWYEKIAERCRAKGEKRDEAN